MQALIDFATQFIQDHQSWVGPIVFLLTLGESMLLVGMLIPATALLLMAGGLVGSNTLHLLPVLLWGYAGAILGDAVSYWIGKKLGPSVLRWQPLLRYRTKIARARLFFYRYGFIAVLVGRFLGPLRSTVPTVAGVMGMTEFKFQLANVLSALFWVPGLLAPGYFAARALQATHASSLARETTIYSAVGICILMSLVLLIILSRRNQTRTRKKQKKKI